MLKHSEEWVDYKSQDSSHRFNEVGDKNASVPKFRRNYKHEEELFLEIVWNKGRSAALAGHQINH
jgi:hypothetical protein